MQWTEANIAQQQQQIVHLNQSISHLVQLVQTFLRGNPGANYVQASDPRAEFHEPSEAFNDSRGAFAPRMNSSSPLFFQRDTIRPPFEGGVSQHGRQCPRGWVIGLRVTRHPSHALARSFIIMSIFGE